MNRTLVTMRGAESYGDQRPNRSTGGGERCRTVMVVRWLHGVTARSPNPPDDES